MAAPTVSRTAAVWVRGNKVVQHVIGGKPGRPEAPHQEQKATFSHAEQDLTAFLGSKWQIVGAAPGSENTDILLLEEWSW